MISGVGQSAIGRQVDRSGFQLTLDAILAAVADAGLTLDDIDGLAMFPGGGKANLPGYANGNLYEVQDALRHHDDLAAGAGRGHEPALLRPGAGGGHRPGPPRRHLAHGEGGQRGPPGRRPARRTASIHPDAEGPLAWLLPVGALSPVCQVAPYATRYMHEFGVTREQLAWIPVTQRAHAALNPDAVYRDAADRRRLPGARG